MGQEEVELDDAAAAALLDELVPPRPDGRLPGAGGLGLVAELRRALRERPELRAVVLPGLAALDALVRARGAARLSELDPDARRAALDALSAQAPALVPTLSFVVFIAYYQDPRVLEALGREPRPPFPKGFELPAGDLSSLDRVRARGPIYRRP
jgi:hypothetical protein